MSLYAVDGRAVGRRWPVDFDRTNAEAVLPLLPDDRVVPRWAFQRGVHPVRCKVHLASEVLGDLTFCGLPFVDEQVPEPFPLPLCVLCALRVYSDRRTRQHRAEVNAEYERLDMMCTADLRAEIAQLQTQRDYLLGVLAEHGLLLE
jgi:hypothetical protein